ALANYIERPTVLAEIDDLDAVKGFVDVYDHFGYMVEPACDEDEEHPNDEESEHDDTVPDDNGDEVDDHVKEKRGSGWAFWGNSNTNVESTLQNVKDSKSSGASDQDNVESTSKKDKAVHVGNTILSSTSKFLVKSESTGKAPQNTEQVMMSYCINPHDKTAQFNQINTHKNEDLRENLIVPDWNTCLPQTATNPIFNTSTTSNQRACLPNYNKYYHNVDEKSIKSASSVPSQLQEDSSDPNSITITNDAMGNLLINNSISSKRRALHQALNAEVISQKAGPLKKIKDILIIGSMDFFPLE
ncbi:hypothetical protein FOB64_001505, partial [Candida albicans]